MAKEKTCQDAIFPLGRGIKNVYNKHMKRLLLLLALLSQAGIATALTAEARYTHGVFYRDMQRQPVLQLKITGEPGEKITSITFTPGETSKPGDIKLVRLSSRDDWNGYTFNTSNYIYENAKGKFNKGKITFKHEYVLGSSPLYIWLSYDIAPGAVRNGKIDAVCTSIKTEDGEQTEPEVILAEALEERKIGRVYRFPYRIVPYYRPRWVKGWGNAEKAVHLTPEHFNLFTDLIHFAYCVTAEGNIDYQWAGGGQSNQQVADEALEEIKRLHKEGKSKAKLIAGFAHMDEPMTAAVANPHTRRVLARNMATWAIERGYDGIDIDWEYPDSDEQWKNLGYFIADLREELSGSAISISIASSVGYKVPNYWTTDQLDFIMTMSYDDLTPDNHASMRLFQRDADICQNKFRMPKQKIVLGLPFYSNEQGKIGPQYGYSGIYSWNPRMKPDVNNCRLKNEDGTEGPMHTFNGPALISEKCRWAKENKIGGVMIWAYETDLPLKHKASLSRAMFKVIRQPQKKQK